MAQDKRYRESCFGMRYPDAFDQFEGFNTLWQRLAHNYGDFRFCAPLVFPQLGQPQIAPVSRTFCLPQNRASRLSPSTDDAVEYIPAKFPFRHRLDRIEGKLCP